MRAALAVGSLAALLACGCTSTLQSLPRGLSSVRGELRSSDATRALPELGPVVVYLEREPEPVRWPSLFARTIYGIGRDGGMAEELCVERSCLVPLPATVALSSACLVEPLAVAIHACVRGRVQPGEKVAVIGAGAIGLASVAALQSLGCEVDLSARHVAQHEAGERLGAGLSLGSDYDAVFDAAGSTESLREAIERVRPRGRVILEASYFGDLVVSGLLLTMKEIELIPAMMYGWHAGGREIDSAAALLAARPELPDALITHRFPLDAAPEAFRIAADRGAGAIKVVLEC